MQVQVTVSIQSPLNLILGPVSGDFIVSLSTGGTASGREFYQFVLSSSSSSSSKISLECHFSSCTDQLQSLPSMILVSRN